MSIQPKPGCNFCPPRKEFAVVAENGRAVAIICDTAKSWGHSLIIPKEHSSNLASTGMDKTIWKKGIIPLLREVIKKFKKNPQVIGFHINSNAGSSAEQTVFHTHIHVVPKHKKDKDEWVTFLNGGNFTSEGSKLFSGRWDATYQNMMDYINDCLQKGILNKNSDGAIESFNLLARIGDGELGGEEHFEIIPKTGTSNYRWNGGGPHLDFATREKIAERIKNEQWEEEKPNGQEEINNKDFKKPKDSEKNDNSQEKSQNNDSQKPDNDQKLLPRNKESGNENGNQENEENRKRSEKPNDWKETLKEIDNSLEQTFNDAKISEWQAQEKGSFNTVDGVKKLLESVKNNNAFLTEIKSKYLVTDLSGLITNKSPQQVIIIIKRFEYNTLSVRDREIKDKKIKAYYKQLNQLAKSGKLTEEQINGYLYKQAIGEVNESSIKIENERKNIKPSESNLAKAVKLIGIISLVLAGGVLFVLFIRKRKKRLDR